MSKGKNNSAVTRVVKTDRFRDESPLEPLNPKQAEYINAIRTNSVVLCTGVLGSSKTYCPAVIASDMLLSGDIEKIVVARPAEGAGKGSGFLPGTSDEKLTPWCQPVIDTLKKRLGEGNYKAFLDNGKVALMDLTMVKGRTFDDTFMLIDEAEDIDIDVIKNLVTRQGIRSKLVISGDIAQKDLKKHSGLEYILQVVETQNLPVSHIDFDSWDYCVRGDEAKMWGMGFEAYDKLK